jgi:hypothetical protein
VSDVKPADPGLFNSLGHHIRTIQERYTRTRNALRMVIMARTEAERDAALDIAKEVLGEGN